MSGENTEFSLYGGEVTGHLDSRHRYIINDPQVSSTPFKVPGASTLAKIAGNPGALMQWHANFASEYWLKTIEAQSYEAKKLKQLYDDARLAPRRKANQRAKEGTATHVDLAEYFGGNKGPEGLPQQFLEWVDNQSIETLQVEGICYSRKHRYAGTFDWLGKLNGLISLPDFKTSGSGIYPEMFVQNTLYQIALEEEKIGLNIEQLGIIRVPFGGDEEQCREWLKNKAKGKAPTDEAVVEALKVDTKFIDGSLPLFNVAMATLPIFQFQQFSEL